MSIAQDPDVPAIFADAELEQYFDLERASEDDHHEETLNNAAYSVVMPENPCDYCFSKGLDCFMSFGKVTCKPCDALFRTCSFAHVQQPLAGDLPKPSLAGQLDTLHVVEEGRCRQSGGLTGTRALKSQSHAVNSSSSNARSRSRSADAHSQKGESEKKATRFSHAQVKVLRDWFAAHSDQPYPTEDERSWLERRTGLKQGQISTWLANARRRRKGPNIKRSFSPAVGQSAALDLPAPADARPWSDVSEKSTEGPPLKTDTLHSSIPSNVGNTPRRRTIPHPYTPSQTPWPVTHSHSCRLQTPAAAHTIRAAHPSPLVKPVRGRPSTAARSSTPFPPARQ